MVYTDAVVEPDSQARCGRMRLRPQAAAPVSDLAANEHGEVLRPRGKVIRAPLFHMQWIGFQEGHPVIEVISA